MARGQQTRVCELRAALPLSNLYHPRGRNHDAAILLESVSAAGRHKLATAASVLINAPHRGILPKEAKYL
jgi:hypothetical protein